MARDVDLKIRYLTEFADKGTQGFLRADRKLRRELESTEREMRSQTTATKRTGQAADSAARDLRQLDRATDSVARSYHKASVEALALSRNAGKVPAAAPARRGGADPSGLRVGASAALGGGARAFASGASGAAASVLGIAGVSGALRKMAEEYTEAAKVGAQTRAVIKSTGGAANVTAADVERLATSVSNATAKDDELIQSGANLLLTFKGVRNEIGAGNDIFNQATRAAVDLSAAGFGSVSGASKQLGKALNDPVKGISALSRAGVTFTQGQKDQIAALVASNRTLDAQKIILREVNAQVAGSARAQAQPVERARVALDNLAETAGTALAPSVEKAADKVATFVGQVQAGTGAGGRFADDVRKAWAQVRPFAESLKDTGAFLARHPQLILAAGGAYAAFRAARGVVATFNAVRRAGGALQTGLGWMARTRLGSQLVSRLTGPLSGLGSAMLRPARRARAPFVNSLEATGRAAGRGAAASTAGSLAGQLPASMNARQGRVGGIFSRFMRGAARGAGIGAAVLIASEVEQKLGELLPGGGGDTSRRGGIGGGPDPGRVFDPGWIAERLGIGRRRGGFIPRFNAGGRVPILASGGEMYVEGGRASMVPGPSDRDGTLMMARPGAAVITGHGQQLMAMGASLREAVRHQLPHFQKGGAVVSAALGRKVGLSGTALQTAVAVAGAESGHRDNASNRNSNGSIDRGRWQINSIHGNLSTFDPLGNARAMRKISSGGKNWRPWVAYTTGAHRKHLADAQDAVFATRAGGIRGPKKGAASPGELLPDAERTVSVARTFGRSSTRGGLLSDAFGTGLAMGQSGLRKLGAGFVDQLREAQEAFTRKVTYNAPGVGRAIGEPDRGGGNARNAIQRVTEMGRGSGAMTRMLAVASAIDKARMQYSWGGGHASFPRPSVGTITSRGGKRGLGYDCSGAVSAVLHAGGLANRSRVSGEFMNYGQKGHGKRVSIIANPGHVIMRLAGRYFGTSGQNPGGGAGWLNGNTMAGRGAIRHPAGFRAGGVVQRFRTGGGVARAATATGAQVGKKMTDAGVMKFVERVWGRTAPLLDANFGVPTVKIGGVGSGSVASASQSSNTIRLAKDYPKILGRRQTGDRNYYLNALLHEFAHMRQETKGFREREGGASWFANLRSPGVFRGMGIAYRNPPMGTDPYAKHIRWVQRNKTKRWALHEQFAGDRTEPQDDARRLPRFQNGTGSVGRTFDSTTRSGPKFAPRIGRSIGRVMRWQGGSLEALDRTLGQAAEEHIAELRRAVLKRIRRGGDAKTITRLQQALDVIDGQLGLRVGRAERFAERAARGNTRRTARLDRDLRTRGIDADSSLGLLGQEATEAVNRAELTKSARRIGVAIKTAQRAGQGAKARELADKLKDLQDEIAESATRSIELMRERVRKAAEEAVERFQRPVTYGQQELGGLDSHQRRHGYADTAGGIRQRGEFVLNRIVPNMTKFRDELYKTSGDLARRGDAAGSLNFYERYRDAFFEVEGALADGAELMRDAARRAADDISEAFEKMVDRANTATDLADMGYDRLEIDQKLLGTFDTALGAEGRANYIRTVLIPKIQEGIGALEAKRENAIRSGNADLAAQLYNLIFAEGTRIARATLEASEQTAQNTEPLKDLLSSLSFEYRGENFTDDLASFNTGT